MLQRSSFSPRLDSGPKTVLPTKPHVGIGDRPLRYPLAWENQFSPEDVRELLFGLGRRPTHRALFVVRSELVYVFAIRHVAQEPLDPESLDVTDE